MHVIRRAKTKAMFFPGSPYLLELEEAEKKARSMEEIASFTQILRSSGNSGDSNRAREIHATIMESQHAHNTFLANLTVEMYGKCAELQRAREAYDRIFHPNLFSGTIMLDAYAQHGHMLEAQRIFDSMEVRNVVAWTAMVSGYARSGYIAHARCLFDRMPYRNIITWNSMLSAYSNDLDVAGVEALHREIPKRDLFSGNIVISAYAQAGDLHAAKRIFDSMGERDVFSWNGIIFACCQSWHVQEAKALFEIIPMRDLVSYNTVLTAYAQFRYLDEVHEVFVTMPRRDIATWTCLIAAYGQGGYVKDAREAFARMSVHDVVASNSLIYALALNGHLEEAEEMFDRGRRNVSTYNTMISAYGTKGRLVAALDLFQAMVDRDSVSWNAIIKASAHNGEGKRALGLFWDMELEGFRVDETTMVGVLMACSRAGLVEVGRIQFASMPLDRGLQQQEEHYCCMIDVLGRAGFTTEAEDLIDSMPFKPGAVAWSTLLASSRAHGDVQRAARAARSGEDLGSSSARFDQPPDVPLLLKRVAMED